jgi:hypothetical protein
MSKAIVSFYTSAAKEYDGFSTETVATVGIDNRSGKPVRHVKCLRVDYDWQTSRYSSGLCRYTSERMTLADYERFGDWFVDHDMIEHTPDPEDKRPAYVKRMQAERDEARMELEALRTKVTALRSYLTSDKFRCGDEHEIAGFVNIRDVLSRID